MLDKEFLEFWGEPISVYTDADALGDGLLIDVSDLNVHFNGQIINRITFGADDIVKVFNAEKETAAADLLFVSLNAKKDREGETAWGIFEPCEKFPKKLWLVNNEVGGYTLMLPEEY